MTYIITITEQDVPRTALASSDLHAVEHYKRRVEMSDVNAVIERLDAALKIKARKPRSDAGQTRKPATI